MSEPDLIVAINALVETQRELHARVREGNAELRGAGATMRVGVEAMRTAASASAQSTANAEAFIFEVRGQLSAMAQRLDALEKAIDSSIGAHAVAREVREATGSHLLLPAHEPEDSGKVAALASMGKTALRTNWRTLLGISSVFVGAGIGGGVALAIYHLITAAFGRH